MHDDQQHPAPEGGPAPAPEAVRPPSAAWPPPAPEPTRQAQESPPAPAPEPYVPPTYRPSASHPSAAQQPWQQPSLAPGPTVWGGPAPSPFAPPPAYRTRPEWVVPVVVTASVVVLLGVVGLVSWGVALLGGAPAGDVATGDDSYGDVAVGEYTFQMPWLGVDAEDARQLSVGDCFDVVDVDGRGQGAVEVASTCGQAHEGEVYATTTLSGSAFPGEDVVYGDVLDLCEGSAFTDYVGIDYDDSEFWYGALAPSRAGWEAGARDVRCFAIRAEQARATGSVEDTDR